MGGRKYRPKVLVPLVGNGVYTACYQCFTVASAPDSCEGLPHRRAEGGVARSCRVTVGVRDHDQAAGSELRHWRVAAEGENGRLLSQRDNLHGMGDRRLPALEQAVLRLDHLERGADEAAHLGARRATGEG